jgi:hypothetical protein
MDVAYGQVRGQLMAFYSEQNAIRFFYGSGYGINHILAA